MRGGAGGGEGGDPVGLQDLGRRLGVRLGVLQVLGERHTTRHVQWPTGGEGEAEGRSTEANPVPTPPLRGGGPALGRQETCWLSKRGYRNPHPCELEEKRADWPSASC